MTESFAELFEQSLANQRIRPGMILTGLIIDVTDDVVIVNVGLKSEAVIPLEQFKNERGEVEVKAGDQVEVALDSVEDGTGETRLSREKAKRARTWTRLEEAFNKSEIVTGVITGRVKGGFTVELDNVRAFLPGSLVDVRPVRDTSYLEGKPLEFKVIKLDQKRNNVVVSRRAVVEQEFSAERSALMDNLQEGAVVKGTVKNLTDYGAFVDLGGIDGLLHITDMAWKRVKHPSEVVKVGDEVEVRILKFDRERSRVSLGLKQLGADPWQNIARRYPPNTRVFGKVTNIADYGAFVEIEDGVEGLVHVSEMDWTKDSACARGALHTCFHSSMRDGPPRHKPAAKNKTRRLAGLPSSGERFQSSQLLRTGRCSRRDFSSAVTRLCGIGQRIGGARAAAIAIATLSLFRSSSVVRILSASNSRWTRLIAVISSSRTIRPWRE